MRTTICLGLLACALALAGGESTFDAAGRAKSLAPWIEEETFALARVDVRRIDAAALLNSLSPVLPSRKEEIDEVRPRVKAFQTAFLEAGGTELIVSFSVADVPPVSLVHVPLKAGAKSDALLKLLNDTLAPWGRAEKREGGLVVGSPETLARQARSKPSVRPELLPAVQAAGDSAAQFLLLPTNDQRRVVEEVVALPELPGSGKTISRGARWAAFGVNVGAKPSAKLTLQSADEDAAKKVARLMTAGWDDFGKMKFFGQVKSVKELHAREFGALARALVPTVTENVVTLQVSEPETFQTLAALVNAIDQNGGAADRSPNGNKLKQILIAMHNYTDTFGTMPPHAIYSKDGKPLLSWRVALLPFLDEGDLYKEFKLDEPWDSDHNKKLIDKMPRAYRSPLMKGGRKGRTTYLVPVHAESSFTGTKEGLKFPNEFKDGTSNTTMLVDANDESAVIWTKPADLMVDKKDPWKGLLGHYPAFVLVGQGDGTLWRIPKATAASTIWALFTRNGGEVLPDLSK